MALKMKAIQEGVSTGAIPEMVVRTVPGEIISTRAIPEMIVRTAPAVWGFDDTPESIECPFCHEWQQPTLSGHCPGCQAGLR